MKSTYQHYHASEESDFPEAVHLAIRQAIWFLSWASAKIADEIYDERLEREGMAINLGGEAGSLEGLLESYGLPTRWDPAWLTEPETEAEEVERKLLKKG